MKTQVFEKDVVGKTVEAISTDVYGVAISFTDGTFLWGIGNYCESVNFNGVFNARVDGCQECVNVGIMSQDEYDEIVSQRLAAQQARRDAYEQQLVMQKVADMENMSKVLGQLQALSQDTSLGDSVLSTVDIHIAEVEQSISRLKLELECDK